MKVTYQLKLNAYHEASHAVAAIVQGLSIVSITIKPDEESLGACFRPDINEFGKTNMRVFKQIVRKYMIGSYAGYQGEKLIDFSPDEEPSKDDYDNAKSLAHDSRLSPDSTYYDDEAYQKYFKRIKNEAAKLIQQNRGMVKKVAKKLLEKETLSGEQVAKLISEMG